MIDQPESGPFRLSCPLCKGTFTGRLPARAAKGLCPLCQKDLVLLPDGKIQKPSEYQTPHTPAPPVENNDPVGEQNNMGKSIFATLLFLIPVVILTVSSSIHLPEKTHNIFDRLGERAGKGLLEMKSRIESSDDSEKEVEEPTRQNSRES